MLEHKFAVNAFSVLQINRAQKWPAGTQRNHVVAQKWPAGTQGVMM